LSKVEKSTQKEKISSEVAKAQSRIFNARSLMLDKEIEPGEYREITNAQKEEIAKLE
jgi:hypothetical protein